MIRLHNIRVSIKENIDLKQVVCQKLKVAPGSIESISIHKKSIDARNKKYFSYVFDLDVNLACEDKYLGVYVTKVLDENYHLPKRNSNIKKASVTIIGAGPAGLFCGYMLALRGYKPVIIERGECLEERVTSVDEFWKNSILNEKSNVQFGEGGAGTFSDGKLNTLVKDKRFIMKEVFKIFVECGASKEIMYESKPHIGTDVLRKVVVNLRNKILAFGGVIRYNSCLTNIKIENNTLKGIYINDEFEPCDLLVLAIGHSARDTFRMFYQNKLQIEAKPFAVGLRIIHSQDLINENQYPINYAFLPQASYKLTYKAKNNRGVYSFCMCPGGYVVNASSTNNGVCTNGMSNYNRDSGYANSAIIVTVNEQDFAKNPLGGLEFQEQIEQKAYFLTKGSIAIQSYLDYKANKLEDKNFPVGAFKGQVKLTNINEIFPDFINDTLKEAIDYFDNKIKGFNNAYLAAPEARSSSPIRIVRNESLESNIKGIYPCGEGSGYAGGITTSAMDGIKVFEEIYKNFDPIDKVC